MRRPLVTLLSDFGNEGPYVAEMRAALLALLPEVRLIDISHEVPTHDVLHAAWVLAAAAPRFPDGSVHLAVVDPGVGSERRALVVETRRHRYVGPDNGLFTLVYEHEPEAVVYSVENRALLGEAVHPTFHGRDLFAPLAARLAEGLDAADAGPRIADPIQLAIDPPRRASDGRWQLFVLHVDRFGNIALHLSRAAAARLWPSGNPSSLALADGSLAMPFVETYSQAPHDTLVALWGSSGYLELALREGQAARRLGVRAGDTLELTAMTSDS
ncbi:MAG: SAM-dependent chlorinase/fluorinase [Acidobacteriota bacterium]|nr:MAG: SAM-dependent chlorinase/fluorinase [Acidobacteriota bacterium]